MRAYLDTSVALHALLPTGSPGAIAWFNEAAANGIDLFSSTLLRLELIRALRREDMSVAIAQEVLDRVHQVTLDDSVIGVASAIEPHVRSLDAIHLATCTMLGGNITLVSHDYRMLDVAGRLGIETVDPLRGP